MKKEMKDMTIVEGFIALAKFLRDRPELAERVANGSPTINISAYEGAAKLTSLTKEFGACEKTQDELFYILRKRFGPITVDLYSSKKDICRRIQVGEKEIPEQIIPAKPEEIIPAKPEEIIPAHTEPIYEWRCPESILEKNRS